MLDDGGKSPNVTTCCDIFFQNTGDSNYDIADLLVTLPKFGEMQNNNSKKSRKLTAVKRHSSTQILWKINK